MLRMLASINSRKKAFSKQILNEQMHTVPSRYESSLNVVCNFIIALISTETSIFIKK